MCKNASIQLRGVCLSGGETNSSISALTDGFLLVMSPFGDMTESYLKNSLHLVNYIGILILSWATMGKLKLIVEE